MPLPLVAALQLLGGELELTWRGPPTCPDAAVVVREIEGALGRPLAPVRESPIVASGALERRADGGPFVLVLEVRRGEAAERREFAAVRCEALAEAAAVVLAAAIDPSLQLDAAASTLPQLADRAPTPDPPEAAPAAAQAPTPAPALPPDDDLPPPDPPAPAAPTAAEPRLAALLRLGPALAVGLTPGVTGGLTGGLSLVTPRLRVDLDGVWLAPRVDDPGLPDLDLRFRVGVGAGALRVCARPRLGPAEFPTCLGGQVGRITTRGVGADIDGPVAVASPWAAVLVGAGARLPFLRGRLAVHLRADALLALARPRFGLAGLGLIYTTPPVALQPSLALEVRLP